MLIQRLLLFAVKAAATASVLLIAHAEAVEPGSQLIGCDQADTQVTIGVSSHLDPSCTWTRGVEIVASDVVVDCQGANIATTDRRYGILITAPTDVALSNIVVRNCHVEGFLNNVRITRDGFRDLAEGQEYDHAFSNIVVEDSTFLNSRGVGVFVDGYVTDVTLRNLHIEGSGSTGIYLEAGSKDNVVENNKVLYNGYTENGPNGQFFELAGISFWFWGTGREGLAIDGSRNNRVVNNLFAGNSAGAIFLYKNCGEFVNERPERWWHRRYGAVGNLIEGNIIVAEDNGVWLASRMGENTLLMDCSDPAYVSTPFERVVLDYAHDNIVRTNVFWNVTYGVRVEDDRNFIASNEFIGDSPAQQAIVIGTRFRTPALALPVEATTITGNRSSIAGNNNPYRWIHGHLNTTYVGNESLGRIAGLCEGEQPPTTPFIFVVTFEVADPENPPTGDPPTLPPPEPLPPCPTPVPDHYKCYKTRHTSDRVAERDVTLEDQFVTTTATVKKPVRLCNPVDKNEEGVTDTTAHLMCYDIRESSFERHDVIVHNQFGELALTVTRADSLCVPAEKDGVASDLIINHFKCYKITKTKGTPMFTPPGDVTLEDQFETKLTRVVRPKFLCTPVEKNSEQVVNPEAHIMCYKIKDAPGQPKFERREVNIVDQFAEQDLQAVRGDCRAATYLCVPSTKRLASPSGAFLEVTSGAID